MRFDNKNNKQRAKSLKIGELSGVTIPAVPGSLATMRKYASKAASAEQLLGIAIDDEKKDEIEAMLRDPLNGKTLDERIKTVRSKLTKADGSDFAYVDGDVQKLPLDTPERVKAAAQALSPAGFRGKKVQIPADKLEAVKAKVRAAYRKAYPDLDVPKHLEKNDMSDTKKVEELEKQLSTANALAAMNDVEKAHYHTLDSDEKRDQFLKFSPEEREATVDMMKAADETYQTSNGATLRKSAVGADVFAMLKSQDQELVKMRDEQQVQEFIKAANGDERKHLPGDEKAKAKALRAVDGMPDDVKKTISEMLNAGNASLGNEYTVKASAHTHFSTGEDALDTLAKAYQVEHQVSYSKAYEEVMNSPEGMAAYNESLGA